MATRKILHWYEEPKVNKKQRNNFRAEISAGRMRMFLNAQEKVFVRIPRDSGKLNLLRALQGHQLNLAQTEACIDLGSSESTVYEVVESATRKRVSPSRTSMVSHTEPEGLTPAQIAVQAAELRARSFGFNFDLKRCSRCGQQLSEEHFYTRKRTNVSETVVSEYPQAYCKCCSGRYLSLWRIAKKEAIELAELSKWIAAHW